MDKREIILSTIAGLATVAVGYVVWKHEMTVSSEQAAANLQAQQQSADDLQSAIAQLPAAVNGSYGGGASQQSYYGSSYTDTGATSLQAPAGYSSDLDKILSAFYPTTPATPDSAPAASASGTPGYITTQLQTGTAKQTYNLVLPTSLPSYIPPAPANIYHAG